MNFSELLPLFAQVPLVGIFVWFVLERDKRESEARQHRDEQWRGFLTEQRQSTNMALQSLADSLERVEEKQVAGLGELAKQIAGLTSIIVAHDTRAQEFIARERKGER